MDLKSLCDWQVMSICDLWAEVKSNKGAALDSLVQVSPKSWGLILSLKVGEVVRNWRVTKEKGKLHTEPRGGHKVRWGEGRTLSPAAALGRVVCSTRAPWLVGMDWGVTRSRAGGRHGHSAVEEEHGLEVWLGRRPGRSCPKAGLFIPQFRCVTEHAVTRSVQLWPWAFLSYPKDDSSTT